MSCRPKPEDERPEDERPAKAPRVVETVAVDREKYDKMKLLSGTHTVQVVVTMSKYACMDTLLPGDFHYKLRAILGQIRFTWPDPRTQKPDDFSDFYFVDGDGVRSIDIRRPTDKGDDRWYKLCEFLKGMYRAHLECFLRGYDVDGPGDFDDPRNEDPTEYSAVQPDTIEYDATWLRNAAEDVFDENVLEPIDDLLYDFLEAMEAREVHGGRLAEEDAPLPRPTLRVYARAQ
tara:strand:- start:5930 stop:6625 length:696 start_codon:yes stop_codon:yes gene_type:complete